MRSMRPSASSAAVNTTCTWVEVSSAETRSSIHLRDTTSTMANTARLARVKWVQSQIHTSLGS